MPLSLMVNSTSELIQAHLSPHILGHIEAVADAASSEGFTTDVHHTTIVIVAVASDIAARTLVHRWSSHLAIPW